MKAKIEQILKEELPNAFTRVVERKAFYGEPYLAIHIAASDYKINNISGQFPAHCSLMLLGLGLEVQVYGGSGGNRILRFPRVELQKEKYLCYGSEKVKFRRPQRKEAAVLRAIRKFAQNWKSVIGSVISELPHSKEVDYAKAIS